MRIDQFPRPDWSPLPMEGCERVEGCVLHATAEIVVAMLKFEPRGTIHEHAAAWNVVAMCIEGSGWVSVGDEHAEFKAGQSVLWPAGKQHRLWTEEESMTTIMLEHLTQKS
jgi:quercetin dioxygenase-like cupin family protein